MQQPPSDPDVLGDVAPYLAAVEHRLRAVAEEIETDARSLSDEAAFDPLFDELRAMMSGGKYVRPAFVYWGWRAAGGAIEAPAPVVCAGAAMELLQTCALVHDDIMDASPSRRGRPAAHVRFSDEAAAAGWPVDPGRFGESAALLLGDLALVAADGVFTDGLVPGSVVDDAWRRAFALFTTMRVEVTLGQYLDVVEGARRGSSAETALAIASLKTARYTVERPLLVGASLGGASREVDRVLSDYGRNVGIAFQLRDDLLGAFGDPEVTGKPVGVDFKEGKQTYLLARTLEAAGDGARSDLRALIGDPDLTPEGIAAVQATMREAGAEALCEEEISHRLLAGLAALEESTLPPAPDAALRSLARQMAYRTR